MEWYIHKGAKNCSHCERLFEEEEEYFSVLYDSDNAYTRKDFCLRCWDANREDESFSYWKTKVQKKSAPVQKYAHTEVFYDLFVRSENEENVSNINFRYVLSLYLMRKKVLTLLSIDKTNGNEFLIFRNLKEGKEIKVFNPKLGKEGILAVKEEIGKLIGIA